MNKIYFIVIAIATILLASCSNNDSKKVAEFWETDNDFEAPADWVTYTYADAFTIKIPKYMKEKQYDLVLNEQNKKADPLDCFSLEKNELGKNPLNIGETAFTSFEAYTDSLHNEYARIQIEYIKADRGDFLGSLDYADINSTDSKNFCNALIKSRLGNGKLIKVRTQQMFLTNKANRALDICYQRVGMTEGKGPVTVHIYFLQHTDEAVLITVSYHDNNHKRFKDLFNIVQTLEWIHYKSSNLQISE